MAPRRRVRRDFDHRTMAEAYSHPGIDPREWIAYGVVEGQTQDDSDPEVTFDEEYGPLVKVVLQPSKRRALCRVGAFIAGNGEAEYHPFVKGDEVLVAIPEGDERADCVILCRLNNAIDKFPMDSVAGQDATTNTFGFRRARTPTVHEYAGPFTLRSALTGALLAFDNTGALTLRGGDDASGAAPALQLSADVIGFQSSDATMLVQLDMTGEHFIAQVKDAILSISSSTANPEQNMISVPGSFALITGTNAAAEHAASAEAVANMVANMIMALGAAIALANPGPLTGAVFGTQTALPLAGTAYATGITAAAATPIDTAIGLALFAAFQAQGAVQKPPAGPTGQTAPGIGCAALLVG